DASAQEMVQGKAPQVGENKAFKSIVDEGGSIKGEVSREAVLRVYPSKAKDLNQIPGTEEYIPFRASYGADSQGGEVLATMSSYGVNEYKSKQPSGFALSLLMTFLVPVILIVALWFLFVRQIQNSGN